jgi:sulfide:quinone oxidoreductase
VRERQKEKSIMDPRPVTEAFTASPQIDPQDAAEIARQGYTAIINNRPDGEEPGQPSSAEIAAAAQAAGLAYAHIPIAGGAAGEADICAMADAIKAASGPVFAFCRSGTRSTILWALSQAPQTAPNTLIEAAGRAGYDVSGLAPYLSAQFDAGSAT